MYIPGYVELWILSSSLRRLDKLRRLDLDLYCRKEHERAIGEELLQTCPRSLESLRIELMGAVFRYYTDDVFDPTVVDLGSEDENLVEGDEGENGADNGGSESANGENVGGTGHEGDAQGNVTAGVSTSHKLEDIGLGKADMEEHAKTRPLLRLKTFWCWDLAGMSKDDILSFFEVCPNIEQLHLPNICGKYDIDELARTIGTLCPKLHTLQFYGREKDTNIKLPFKIMEHLPGQRVERVSLLNFNLEMNERMARSVFQRHSTTLHTLILQGCSPTDSEAVRVIVTECGVLEDLRIMGTHYKDFEAIWPFPKRNGYGCGILLVDAIAKPWACTRIKRLELFIRANELHSDHHSRLPACYREAPVELTPKETEYFASWERFYRQIGALIELRYLELRLELCGHRGQDLMRICSPWEICFPILMSLGDEESGRLGYLSLLGGLSKLKELRGSFRTDTRETSRRVGWAEAKWTYERWPELEVADFLSENSETSEPFMWLQEQQRKRQRNLIMAAPYVDDLIVRGWAFPPL
ncbi:hypothetical protein BGX23_007642 [Mortierella sp. AD031]|nr:hypothetical protein BGX23_007642 [Mortierella sp. AD031]